MNSGNEHLIDSLQIPTDQTFLAHTTRGGRIQLLSDHLTQVSALSGSLAAKVGLQKAGELIGLIHDVGKYSSAFQQYIRKPSDAALDMEPSHIDHSTAGAQWIWNHFTYQSTAKTYLAAEFLALCVASHHSGLIDCIKPDGFDDLTRRLRKPDADSHLSEVLGKIETPLRVRIEALLCNAQLELELRGSFERIRAHDKDKVIQPFKRGLLLRILFSCLIDADRTDTADFDKPAGARLRQFGRYTPWKDLIERLERRLAEFRVEKDQAEGGKVNAWRQIISTDCLQAASRPPGIYTLTVPTGGGKTLASLRFAMHHAMLHQLDRIIYVSPYTSIADQNAMVARKILEPSGSEYASVVLEHHSNLTPANESWRGGILSENWDAPVVFTTAVQLLESLFGGGTRAVRRMHALARSVIVFDEAQTIPIRTIHLFNNAINFLHEQCGSTVVLCTATQPLLHRVEPAKGAMRFSSDAELMPDALRLFRELKRVETIDHTRKPAGWKPNDVAALAVKETMVHGSCLVIVNTKRDALLIYLAAKIRLDETGERLDAGCLVHLSTHMCPAHRLEMLDKMKIALANNQRVLCVSTQLIEAGVDIDFAAVVRDLAGLDSIAQAAGRCNRNGLRECGRVHVVKLAALPKSLAEITSAQIVTARILGDWRETMGDIPFDLSDPKHMETYFQYHFFNHQKLMTYPVGKTSSERDDTLLRMLGANRMACEDTRPASGRIDGMMQSFQSAGREFHAIDSLTQGVIVPFRDKGKEIVADLSSTRNLLSQFRLLREAQQFTVNLFEHELASLSKKGATYEAQPETGVLCLQPGFYSDEFGIDLEGKSTMESVIA
jgi:CRISPR-associated endonuclease/helicase Cas3